MDKTSKKLYVVDMPNGFSYVGYSDGPENNPMVIEEPFMTKTRLVAGAFNSTIQKYLGGREHCDSDKRVEIGKEGRIVHFVDENFLDELKGER